MMFDYFHLFSYVAYPSLALPASKAATAPLPSAPALVAGLWSVVRFVDVQRAIAKQGAVQFSDRLFTIGRTGHFHESKLARLARVAIPDDGYSIDRTVNCEELAQLVFGGIEAQVSNENVFHLAPP